MKKIVSAILERVNFVTLIAALDVQIVKLLGVKFQDDLVRYNRALAVKHIIISILYIFADANPDNRTQLVTFVEANSVMTDNEKAVIVRLVNSLFN